MNKYRNRITFYLLHIIILFSISCSPILKEKISDRFSDIEIRKSNKPRKPLFKRKNKKERSTKRKKGKDFSIYRGERDYTKKSVEGSSYYRAKKKKRKNYSVSRSGGPKFSARPKSELASRNVKRGRKTFSKQQKKRSKGENRTSYKAVKLAKKKPKLRKEPQLGLWGGKQKKSKKLFRRDIK